MEFSRVQISRVRIGRILSPELGGAQGWWDSAGSSLIGGFSYSEIGGFCSDF